MLKIRLQRIGKKNQPSYRVVLLEHTYRPQGKYIEDLGFYNPRSKQKNFKKERIQHWISKGAQISPTVFNLLVDEKIVEGKKKMAWKPKKKPASAEAAAGKPVEKKPATTPTPAEGEVGVPHSPDVTSGDVGVDTQQKTAASSAEGETGEPRPDESGRE
jgi:small subunit ribosomal protein S16